MLEQIEGTLKSAFHCTQEALPYLLRADSPSVLNISSIPAAALPHQMIARSAAQGALEALTRSLAIELGRRRVRVNALSVGWTTTDQLLNIPPSVLESVVASIPIGRIASPSEIAATAIFLLSKSASYITGSVFPIAGGLAPDPR